MTVFYLGTHQPHWLAIAGVPLFVSHRRLAGRRTLPRAIAPWAPDSGGFSELSLYGEWRTTAAQYVAAVRRYRDEIGHLVWAASRDWMCVPQITAKTALSVEQHQRRTTADFIALRTLAADLDIVPTIQGWRPIDYLYHLDGYQRAGVDLTAYPVVAVGSVCHRQNTRAAEQIFELLARENRLPLHGFGVKVAGLARYGQHVASSDSMAWSARGRRLPGCAVGHRSEANCLRFALSWRADLIARVAGQPAEHGTGHTNAVVAR